MPTTQVNLTLGTAGHIDHGKTALVKSLTGCETDQLKEEKERGMSIDLGYAPCTIADMEVGIVDVPGHENFIKTMVAGASGMDGVILVVAADDGVMPQTREHLEILTLLGLKHGIVALTKIDRAAPERLAEVRGDIAELLRGTFLEGAPVEGVSNVTGEGFDAFYTALWALVQAIQPKRSDGVFRIPLDRAFSVHGYGTVAAGIPVCGSARIGDELVLLPQVLAGQIRRIEVYGRASDTVRAGQCAAINVGQWDPRLMRRGDVVALPGYFTPREWFVCDLCLLPRAKLLLKSGAHVRFHTGTSVVSAAIYPIKGDRIQAGQRCFVQLRTQQPLVAGPGDRFILRTPSPVQTIGGGTIIEALSERVRRNQPDVQEDLRRRLEATADDRRLVEYCLRTAPKLAASPVDLGQRAKVLPKRMQQILSELMSENRVIGLASGLFIHRDTAAEAAQRVIEHVEEFHRQTPESPGLAVDQLRRSVPIEKAVLDGLLALLRSDGRLVESNQRVATAQHRAAFSDEDARQLEALESLFRQQLMRPPALDELVAKTGLPPSAVERLLRILHEHGRLVQVARDLVFHREAVDRAREALVEHLRTQGKLESVDFKYLLDTTRKFAIPLLDYFDQTGVTRRVGYTRYLKTPPGGG